MTSRATQEKALEKCKKRMHYSWHEVILVQGFCPQKIKITQFPNRSHLNPSIHEIAKVRIKGAISRLSSSFC